MKIADVWAQVPPMQCKGLCAESCGPIAASEIEVRILSDRGVSIATDPEAALLDALDRDALTCSALVDGRCTVYDDRPLICRLWGAVEAMPCPWGCVPLGGRLDRDDGMRLVALSLRATA